MIYLLNTNVVSDMMRSDPRTKAWIGSLRDSDEIIICPVVRGEILFGIARLPPGRRRTELEGTAHRILAGLTCTPIPDHAGDFYASVKSLRRRQGLPLDENDLWIAATALALRATLVSRDTDFSGIEGLAVTSTKPI